MKGCTWKHKSEAQMEGLPKSFLHFKCRVALLFFLFSVISGQDPCVDPSNEGPCKRTPGSCRPKVTVKDTNHLEVNWMNVFTNCEESQIKSVKMFIKTTGEELVARDVSFDQKQVSILANPCLQHAVSIEFEFENSYLIEHLVTNIRSLPTNYNSGDSTDPDYPYSGLLTTRASDICLKENGTVILPPPPSRLINCRIQTGEQKSALKRPGDSGTVSVTFSNPSAPPASTDIPVSNIQECPRDPASTTPAQPVSTPCPPTQDPCPKPDDQPSINGILVLLAVILVVSLALNIWYCSQSLKTGKQLRCVVDKPGSVDIDLEPSAKPEFVGFQVEKQILNQDVKYTISLKPPGVLEVFKCSNWSSSYFSDIGYAIFGKARLEVRMDNMSAVKKFSLDNEGLLE